MSINRREIPLPYRDTSQELRALEELREFEVEVDFDINIQGINEEERRERVGRGIQLLDGMAERIYYKRPIVIVGQHNTTSAIAEDGHISFRDQWKRGIVSGISLGYTVADAEYFDRDVDGFGFKTELSGLPELFSASHSGSLIVCHLVSLEPAMVHDPAARWSVSISPRAIAPIYLNTIYSYESAISKHNDSLARFEELFESISRKRRRFLTDAIIDLINCDDPVQGLIKAAPSIRKALSINDALPQESISIILNYLSAILNDAETESPYQTAQLPPLIVQKEDGVYFSDIDEGEVVTFRVLNLSVIPHFYITGSQQKNIVFSEDQYALYAKIEVLNSDDATDREVPMLLSLEHLNPDSLIKTK